MPTTLHWTGLGTDANGSTTANWNAGAAAPAAGDILIFDGAAGAASNKAAVLDAAMTGSVADIDILNGYSGNVTLQRALTVTDNVDQEAGMFTIIGGAALTAHHYSLNGGTLDGAGTASITGTATDNGSMSIHVDEVGVASLSIGANCTLSICTGGLTFNSTQLTNSGTTTWCGGDITLNLGAGITNLGTFNAACDNTLGTAIGGTSVPFNNYGTFVESADALTTIATPFNNQQSPSSPPSGAEVDVNSGTLDLVDGGQDNAPFVVGSTLIFGAGTHTLSQGTYLQGGLIRAFGGTISIPTNNSVSASGTFELDSGATLTGGGTFYSNTLFKWEGGTIQGMAQVGVTGQMQIAGGANQTLIQTILNSSASTTWTDAGNILMGPSAAINNYGTFNIYNDQIIDVIPGVGGVPQFNNGTSQGLRGTLRKGGGMTRTWHGVGTLIPPDFAREG